MQRSLDITCKPPRGVNDILPEDQPIHSWYNFVLSFPPHLVREYIERFGIGRDAVVLDPFCGTGTTAVECKKLGMASVGIEALPVVHFASSTKTDWSISPDELVADAASVGDAAAAVLDREGLSEIGDARVAPSFLRSLTPEQQRLLIKDSISALPLHRTLVLLEALEELGDPSLRRHELLALASILPTEIGNLRFGPEVGVGAIKDDADAVGTWLAEVKTMAADLYAVSGRDAVEARILLGDARSPMRVLEPQSVDAVITSPPYPNEKDYTRIVRLESVLLGFMSDHKDLRATKQKLLRSNTRNVYKADEDDAWVQPYESIQHVADSIEERRIELGKSSGFEKLYSRVMRLYFGGMARHLANLRPALRPGARLAYVVGDQASYLRIMIRTGQLLAEIAASLGYRVIGIDLFRTRLATATKEELREEVVLLEWLG